MDKYKPIVKRLFDEIKTDLQKGYDIEMQLYLFFEDRMLAVPQYEMMLDKEKALYIFHGMIDHLKPEAYGVVSDNILRHPDSMEVMGEQLMAGLFTSNGGHQLFMQPYSRLEGGGIEFTESEIIHDDITPSGRMTEFYQTPWKASSPLAESKLRELFNIIDKDMARQYDKPAKAPKFAPGGMSLH